MVDIAHNVLHINETIEECISGLTDKKTVCLIVAGPTGHLAAVKRILQNKQIDYYFRQHRSRQIGTLTRAGSGLVAIVGMSGRFPGSETIDSFFEDLLDGKGQIKKVRYNV